MEFLSMSVIACLVFIIYILNSIKDYMLANNKMLYDIRSSLSYTQGYTDSIDTYLKTQSTEN